MTRIMIAKRRKTARSKAVEAGFFEYGRKKTPAAWQPGLCRWHPHGESNPGLQDENLIS